ncbi:MAG: hypothetical protein COB15_02545 [Flavobacteriales bacterium]|nr:MAG: hypothetical protein COB15_02545 [Flavobacteriales bacterium]
MKTKKILLALTFSITAIFCSAQTTAIPDPNFEQALINLGYDSGPLNGSVLTANINTVTSLALNNNISSLTGIEDFTALTVLGCGWNQLTNLDVSQNTALTILECQSNQITNLNLTSNTLLTSLSCRDNALNSLNITNLNSLTQVWCENNQLTSLNISQNSSLVDLDIYNNLLTNLITTSTPTLTKLECRKNQLTFIDVSQNTALTILDVAENQITSTIDVSQNINLLEFYCQDNQLINIDVTNNPLLTNFACFGNQINSLTIAQNPNLIEFGCHNNMLTCLNAKNGSNALITTFVSSGNPNLTCIEVDNVAWSTTNWTSIDPVSSFSTSCVNPCAVGVKEYGSSEFSLYPNPTTGSITINVKEDGAVVEIYDIMGEIILSEKNIADQLTIDLQEQPKGVYFVKVSTEKKVSSQKIIYQ